ncbi:MAG: DUF362 domain-containing protein [Chitinivibrionales bacterium]|nr:DUF362 domain-containing protein [Chitinivibrionales bacterium]
MRTTSLTAGVAALSLSTPSFALELKRSKSLVVIAKDEKCFINNTADAAKVQDMVDNAIMRLTGVSDKAKAYEALFPKGVTASTKILVKYNDAKSNSKSRDVVRSALKKGLSSMLNGTFPAENITEVGKATGAATNEKFSLGSTEYAVRDIWANCDYFINLPSCYRMSGGCGVTLSLKGMMPAVTGTLGTMHNYFTNESSPSFSLLNSQKTFKEKQVLVLIDGICLSIGGSSPDKTGYCVIASKDMVASDYQGTALLKTNGLTDADNTASIKVCDLAAKAPYSIGVSDPTKMEIAQISPPWNTSIISSGTIPSYSMKATAFCQGSSTRFSFSNELGDAVNVIVYTIQGKEIWARSQLRNGEMWNHVSNSGVRVPPGAYFFQLFGKRATAQGRFDILY